LKRFLTLIILSPLPAWSQKQLSITGNVSGLKESSIVSLVDINSPTDTLAKGAVKNGTFKIKASLKETTLVTLNFDNGKKASLFLDNSVVKVTGNANDPKTILAKGSPAQDAFDFFQKKFNPLFESLSKVNQQMQFGGRSDSLVLAENNLRNRIQVEIDAFIKKYKT